MLRWHFLVSRLIYIYIENFCETFYCSCSGGNFVAATRLSLLQTLLLLKRIFVFLCCNLCWARENILIRVLDSQTILSSLKNIFSTNLFRRNLERKLSVLMSYARKFEQFFETLDRFNKIIYVQFQTISCFNSSRLSFTENLKQLSEVFNFIALIVHGFLASWNTTI